MIYLYINHNTGEVTKSNEWNMGHDYNEVTAIRIRVRKKDSRPIATILSPDGEWESIASEKTSES